MGADREEDSRVIDREDSSVIIDEDEYTRLLSGLPSTGHLRVGRGLFLGFHGSVVDLGSVVNREEKRARENLRL